MWVQSSQSHPPSVQVGARHTLGGMGWWVMAFISKKVKPKSFTLNALRIDTKGWSSVVVVFCFFFFKSFYLVDNSPLCSLCNHFNNVDIRAAPALGGTNIIMQGFFVLLHLPPLLWLCHLYAAGLHMAGSWSMFASHGLSLQCKACVFFLFSLQMISSCCLIISIMIDQSRCVATSIFTTTVTLDRCLSLYSVPCGYSCSSLVHLCSRRLASSR